MPSSTRRLPGIEGARALAALSIVVLHVWQFGAPSRDRPDLGRLTALMPDLAFGVTLFFTLSGFLLYRPFAVALLRSSQRPSVAAYLRNRALRILPAYWVILLLSAFVLRSVAVRDDSGELVDRGADGFVWVAKNLSLTQNYTPSGVVTGIGPAWSLAVELAFYVLLPALVVVAHSISNRRPTRDRPLHAALAPPFALLALGLGGKTASLVAGSGPAGGWGADWNSVLERSFVCHADLFAFGMALAVIHVEVHDRKLSVRASARAGLALAAVATYALTTTFMSEGDHLGNSPYNTVMALSCALFLALIVLRPVSIGGSGLVRLLEKEPVVWAGMLSYSIFLWHLPVLAAMRERGLTLDGTAGFPVNLLAVTTVTLVLSLLTYRYVEEPALRRKRSMRRRPHEPPGVQQLPPVAAPARVGMSRST